MRLDRLKLSRLRLFRLVNIAVLIAAAITCIIISSVAGRYIAKDVFYLAPVLNDAQYYFSTEDLEELQAACQPLSVAAISLSSSMVDSGNFSAYSKIIYTDSPLFALNNIQFSSGAGWPAHQKNDNLAVINESLAWQLFGSLDAVDKTIAVDGKVCAVAGVTTQKEISRDDCAAYLPQDWQQISAVFIQVDNYNKLGSALEIEVWLESIHKDKRDYFITDMNSYLENVPLFGLTANRNKLPSRAYLLPNMAELSQINTYGNVVLLCGLMALCNLVFVFQIPQKGETNGRHNLKKRLQNLWQRLHCGKRG